MRALCGEKSFFFTAIHRLSRPGIVIRQRWKSSVDRFGAIYKRLYRMSFMLFLSSEVYCDGLEVVAWIWKIVGDAMVLLKSNRKFRLWLTHSRKFWNFAAVKISIIQVSRAKSSLFGLLFALCFVSNFARSLFRISGRDDRIQLSGRLIRWTHW